MCIRDSLTLGEVAQRSGYNEKYFCTLFKKRLDVSYSDYLTGLRIAAARELLEQTNMRMYEVCDAVGYNSVEHFLLSLIHISSILVEGHNAYGFLRSENGVHRLVRVSQMCIRDRTRCSRRRASICCKR